MSKKLTLFETNVLICFHLSVFKKKNILA